MIELKRGMWSGGPRFSSIASKYYRLSLAAGGYSVSNVVWPTTDVVVWLSRILQPD